MLEAFSADCKGSAPIQVAKPVAGGVGASASVASNSGAAASATSRPPAPKEEPSAEASEVPFAASHRLKRRRKA